MNHYHVSETFRFNLPIPLVNHSIDNLPSVKIRLLLQSACFYVGSSVKPYYSGSLFSTFSRSEWRGIKSTYHPLVYRVEQVREVIERDGKLIRQKRNPMSFQDALERGFIDKKTAEFIVIASGEEIQRLSFAKALAYGLVKVVPLRLCLIEKLPREYCIFA